MRLRSAIPFGLSPVALALAMGCVGSASASLRADLEGLADFVHTVHPAPYRFRSEQEAHALLRREVLELSAADPGDPFAVGRAVHRMLAPLGDVHAQVSLPLYADSAVSLSLLPILAMRVREGVALDAAGQDWPPGTLLRAVEGQEIEALLEELAPLVAADGRAPAAVEAELLADLPRFYALLHGMAPEYAVEVELADGTRERVNMRGATRAAMASLRANRLSLAITGQQGPAPTLAWLDANTALLHLPSFGVADMATYRQELTGLLTKAAQAEGLIVDIRGNRGGLRPNGFPVLDLLLSEPYPQWQGAQVRIRRIPARFGRRVTPLFDGGLERRFAPPGPPFVVEGDPLSSWMSPTGTFDGRVALLVDGISNSAANSFALSLAHYRPDVLVVGSAAGGACDEHIGELPVVYTLPHSGVAVRLSLVRVRHVAPERCVPGAGLSPDLEQDWSRNDLIDGRDPIRERVREVWGER